MRRHEVLEERLVHRERRGEHPGSDVRHVEQLEQSLDGAVLAEGAVQGREDDIGPEQAVPRRERERLAAAGPAPLAVYSHVDRLVAALGEALAHGRRRGERHVVLARAPPASTATLMGRAPARRLGLHRRQLLLLDERADHDHDLAAPVDLDAGSRALVDHLAVLARLRDLALAAHRHQALGAQLALRVAGADPDHVGHHHLLDTGGDRDGHGRPAPQLGPRRGVLSDHLTLRLLRLLLPHGRHQPGIRDLGLGGVAGQPDHRGHGEELGTRADEELNPLAALDLGSGARHGPQREPGADVLRGEPVDVGPEPALLELVDRLCLGQVPHRRDEHRAGTARHLEQHRRALLGLLARVGVLVEHLVEVRLAAHARLLDLEAGPLERGAGIDQLAADHARHLARLGGGEGASPPGTPGTRPGPA